MQGLITRKGPVENFADHLADSSINFYTVSKRPGSGGVIGSIFLKLFFVFSLLAGYLLIVRNPPRSLPSSAAVRAPERVSAHGPTRGRRWLAGVASGPDGRHHPATTTLTTLAPLRYFVAATTPIPPCSLYQAASPWEFYVV